MSNTPRASEAHGGARQDAMNGGAVVWLTGLSGAGKTTVAAELQRELSSRGVPVELLDGDVVRTAFPSLGFSRADRDANVRMVAFVASRLERHGVVVIAALISPYREARAFARGLCRRFVEVHVATPLDVCEARDVKGLYARARRGEISNFTGVDDPYEAPLQPELVIDTSRMSAGDAARAVLDHLRAIEAVRAPAEALR